MHDQPFDAQEWVGGEPLSRAKPSGAPLPNTVRPVAGETLKAVCTAVACLHLKTTGFRNCHRNVPTPFLKEPGVCAHEVLEQKRKIEARIKDRGFRIANRWLEIIPESLSLASQMLEAHASELCNGSVLCHSDLWASHIHFAEGRFVGFVDFEELRLGPPVLDVVQIILHFNGWDSRADVLGFYEKTLELPAKDKIVIPAVAVFELISEGMWAMQCLYGKNYALAPSQRQAHEANLGVLLESLEKIFFELKRAR